MMYEKFFELKGLPFGGTPDTAAYYPSPAHEEALAALRELIRDGDAMGALIGPIGTGKTLVSRLLLGSLEESQSVVFVTSTHMKCVRSLLQAILYDLSLPYDDPGEQELRLRLADHLMERFRQGGGTLLVIDEAQGLSFDQLEELRLLTNLEGRSAKAIQIVLLGQPALAERLNHPRCEALRQRLAVVAALSPLEPEQTVEYVRARIARVSGSADSIFTANALSEICDRSGGIPRRINHLAHHALSIACADEAPTVDAPHVEAAAARLVVPAPLALAPAPAHHLACSLESLIPAPKVVSEPDDFGQLHVVEVGAGCAPRPKQDAEDAEQPTVVDPEPAVVDLPPRREHVLLRGESRAFHLLKR